MPRRKPVSLWDQPVNPYTFAWALGYRRSWEPEQGERACLVNGDWLSCRIYEAYVEIDLYAKEPNAETTEWGSNRYRFALPAKVREWFMHLCIRDHLWTDEEEDRAEFLEMYEEADVQLRVESIKEIFRVLSQPEEPSISPGTQGTLNFTQEPTA